jgi:hypothetical protein
MTMPQVFAGDPAPQQLTAPCRKYSGRSHPPIEQVTYRAFFNDLQGSGASSHNGSVVPITFLSLRAGASRDRCFGAISTLAGCLALALVFPATAAGLDGDRYQGLAPVPGTGASPQIGTITGHVVDAATGAALARVLVVDEASGGSAITDAAGLFALSLPAGPHRLSISVVGYVLVRREIVLEPGAAVALTIPMTGGTGTYSETVTVTADSMRLPDSAAPAQQRLDSADIQNLRGVLADDPLRAVQVLPGAATGDDLRSEFSVRGSNFAHLDFTLDGFSTPFLLHTVHAVEDHSASGSVAMINSDVLADVALLNGGYAQRSGNRTGGAVAFRLREGSRDRTEFRGGVSGTSMSAVGEGPLGSSRRGSWLVSGRYSYLDRVIERLTDDEGVTFGFSDVQGKVVFDPTPGQQASLTVIAGRSRLAESVAEVDSEDLFAGRNASALAITGWRLTGRRGLISAGLLTAVNEFRNDTIEDITLDRGTSRQVTARVDGTYAARSTVQIEAGAVADWTRETRWRQRLLTSTTLGITNDYAGSATRVGGFGMARWTVSRVLTVTPGVRVDHWSLIDRAAGSPWIQAEWRPSPTVWIRAAAGVYRQAPDFEQVLGAWAAPGADLERAAQYDLGAEWRPRSSTRFQLTLFDREDADMMRRADAETRIVGTRLVRGVSAARFMNRLDGSARGVELLAHVRNPNGLTGWVSYSYGRNRYHDRVSAETFWGDLDQRHALNVYGAYRVSARTSISAKLRTGSNFPAPGYYTETAGRAYVTDRRNELRLPLYTRVDVRANRTMTWSHHRLTLFVEVINLLNRDNVRYNPPSIDSRTREARGLFESMIPIVPSAGVLIEF